MKRLKQKLEDLWVAVTFAEAGEHETSKKIMNHEVHEREGVSMRPTVETVYR